MTLEVKNGENKKITGQTFEQFNSLVARTDKENPKPEDLVLLRNLFDAAPSLALSMGNLQHSIFKAILGKAVGHSAFGREATTRYIEQMKVELGYAASSFVEKMLIDEIVLRWLRLQVADNDHKNIIYKEHTVQTGMYVEKQLYLTQKRFLQSIETLIKVRKMLAATQAKGAEMFKNLMKGAPAGE